MPHITDLRTVTQPTMTLVLPDEAGTTVHLCAPTLELVEELQCGSHALFAALRGENGSEETRRAVYELAAKFINCNLDMFKTTSEELMTKYSVCMVHLQQFFPDYVDFLKVIKNEKN